MSAESLSFAWGLGGHQTHRPFNQGVPGGAARDGARAPARTRALLLIDAAERTDTDLARPRDIVSVITLAHGTARTRFPGMSGL